MKITEKDFEQEEDKEEEYENGILSSVYMKKELELQIPELTILEIDKHEKHPQNFKEVA